MANCIPATPEIRIVDGRAVTTSRTLASYFGKQHKNLIQKILQLDCSPEFTELNFQPSEYTDSTGRKLPEYLISRDGFVFLAMGFTGKRAATFKEAYITAFNEMEKQRDTPSELLAPPAPPQRFLIVIDQGQVQQYPLSSDDALIALPKLAAKVKEIEVLHQALGQQIEDLKGSYDLAFFLDKSQIG